MKEGMLLLFCTLIVRVSCQQFFAAVTQLEDVFHLEGKMINELENFMTRIEDNLSTLKKKINEIQEYRKAIEDVAQYLQNPINSYFYVKYLVEYIPQFESILQPILDLNNIFQEISDSGGLPSQFDLEGTARALLRVQSTYDLKLDDLVKGIIFNHKSSPFSAEDSIFIAEVAFESEDNSGARAWINHAYDICFNASLDDCDTVLKSRILENAAWLEYVSGDKVKALEYTNKLVELDPDHERGVINKKFLYEEVHNISIELRSGEFIINPKGRYHVERIYMYACQGLRKPSKDISSQLKCRYTHYNNPYLMIGPVKEEEAYLDPKIVILRDIMFDSEIDDIKNISKPLLQRSAVQGKSDVDVVRVSKVAWLDSGNGETISKLSKRFSAFTDLSMSSSESLQVVNYGLGGHYLTHIDSFSEEDSMEHWGSFGNRVATLLVYMNDVDIGGHTVFPDLGVSVKPTKGSAILWHNLHNDGSTDERTSHAACPVVVGTKWAINVWYHTGYNEFKHPCLPK